MGRPPQPIDPRLLSKVSRLYYQQNLTQQEIAERLGLSRPKVSRLLTQAVETGMVQISIQTVPGIHAALEQMLETRYGLQEAVVVDIDETITQDAVTSAVGQAAAEYLQRTLRDGEVIGISWGNTLRALVDALPAMEAGKTHIVQLIGGLGSPESEIHATDLCRRMARLLGGKLTLIPAPGIVDSVAVKQALLSDRYVQAAFELFARVDVAYVGIGTPSPQSILLRDSTIVSRAELDWLRERGAVGDIALRFLDEHGRAVTGDVDDRVVGITLEQLKAIKRVVGVAGGVAKERVVRGALRGGLLDVLITDHLLARRLVSEAVNG